MSKIPISIHMISNDEHINFKTFGIYNQELGILKYVDCDKLKTHVSLDFRICTLTRENKDIKYILTFNINKDKILNCKLKEMNQTLTFNLKTISLEQQDHLFRVSYEILGEGEILSKIYYEINY